MITGIGVEFKPEDKDARRGGTEKVKETKYGPVGYKSPRLCRE